MPVHIKKDFIVGQDLEDLLSFSKSFNAQDKYLWGYNDIVGLKNLHENSIVKSIDKCFLFLNKEFSERYNLLNDLKVINIFGAGLSSGKSYHRHQDKNYGYEGKKDSDVVYTGLLYLNEDYKGGEIILEDQSIKERFSDDIIGNDVLIKPAPGTLIYFTEDIFHKVLPVTSGTRYNIVMFFSDTDLVRPLAKLTLSENFK